MCTMPLVSRCVLKLWICLVETVKLLLLFKSLALYIRIFFVFLHVMDVIVLGCSSGICS